MLQSFLLKQEIMSKKIVDIVVYLDGLIISEDESVDDVINIIEKKLIEEGYMGIYPTKCKVDYEEIITN